MLSRGYRIYNGVRGLPPCIFRFLICRVCGIRGSGLLGFSGVWAAGLGFRVQGFRPLCSSESMRFHRFCKLLRRDLEISPKPLKLVGNEL